MNNQKVHAKAKSGGAICGAKGAWLQHEGDVVTCPKCKSIADGVPERKAAYPKRDTYGTVSR